MWKSFFTKDKPKTKRFSLKFCGYHNPSKVAPLFHKDKSVIYIRMDGPTFETITPKDFDLSFLVDYEKEVFSVKYPTKPKQSESDHGILKLFDEFNKVKSLEKIGTLVNAVVEEYRLMFLRSVVDDIFIHSPENQHQSSVESKSPVIPTEKLVIFVDDPPNDPDKISWMGRMLTISLLCLDVAPILIPWYETDLTDPFIQTILDELPSSPYAQTGEDSLDYRWMLRKGFTLALTKSTKNIVILDVDWKLVPIQEFIDEADDLGYQFFFMSNNHPKINRVNFVRSMIDRVKKWGRIADSKPKSEIVVEVVKPQGYDLQRLRVDSFRLDKEYGDAFTEKALKEKAGSSFGDGESIDKPRVKERYRAFSKTEIENPNDKSKNKKVTFPKPLRSSTDKPSKPNSDTTIYHQQESNPNILPRLTDQQFERLFVQPKLYAKKCEAEDQIFSQRQSEDLDNLFADSDPTV